MYKTEVEVKGSGNFPIDMLRYDACYPATETDSCNISGENWVNHPNRVVNVVITTATRSEAKPTHRRWQSFGWEVVKVGSPRKVV